MATLRRCEIGASLFTIVNCCLSNRSPSVRKDNVTGDVTSLFFWRIAVPLRHEGAVSAGRAEGFVFPMVKWHSASAIGRWRRAA